MNKYFLKFIYLNLVVFIITGIFSYVIYSSKKNDNIGFYEEKATIIAKQILTSEGKENEYRIFVKKENNTEYTHKTGYYSNNKQLYFTVNETQFNYFKNGDIINIFDNSTYNEISIPFEYENL